ncbi:hypothetical protein [Simiduia aestuariiviva]|uniref:Uncharacterized protein n=1 Tax=Simiduia aestuariiviva TaxID=1510459 RepID=A0A839UT43_9GAMM|nr:hypothetical protein [Simiduia aestuariiviva]MBB3168525.1 hypothetical protein [Simiduia aestuariiviva]
MMFRPSGGQRKLATLRARANSEGLRVRLASGHDPSLKGTALYAMPWRHKGLRSQRWALVRKDYAHDIHVNDFWSWESEAAPELADMLNEQIKALPNTVMGVSAGPEGLGVHWSERGSMAELEFLMAWLSSFQNAMAAKLPSESVASA